MKVLDRLAAEIQLAAPYDPGQGQEPPGAAGIKTAVDWLTWGVMIVAVGSLVFIGGKMMMSRRRGGGGNEAEDLGSWIVGLIIATGAAGIINLLV